MRIQQKTKGMKSANALKIGLSFALFLIALECITQERRYSGVYKVHRVSQKTTIDLLRMNSNSSRQFPLSTNYGNRTTADLPTLVTCRLLAMLSVCFYRNVYINVCLQKHKLKFIKHKRSNFYRRGRTYAKSNKNVLITIKCTIVSFLLRARVLYCNRENRQEVSKIILLHIQPIKCVVTSG